MLLEKLAIWISKYVDENVSPIYRCEDLKQCLKEVISKYLYLELTNFLVKNWDLDKTEVRSMFKEQGIEHIKIVD